MDTELEVKKLKREILELDVSRMLYSLVRNAVNEAFEGKAVDTTPYARRIIAYMREHLIHD